MISMLITSPDGDKFIECNEKDEVVQYFIDEDWITYQMIASITKAMTGWTLEIIETELADIDAACRATEGEHTGLLEIYTLLSGSGFKVLYPLKYTLVNPMTDQTT